MLSCLSCSLGFLVVWFDSKLYIAHVIAHDAGLYALDVCYNLLATLPKFLAAVYLNNDIIQ